MNANDNDSGTRPAGPECAWPSHPTRPTHAPDSRRRQRRHHGLAALGMAAALAVTGCSSTNVDYTIPPEAMSSRPSGTLAVGDVVRVSYPGAPEMNLTQKIGVNGQLSLPTVGAVTAVGRSVGSLQSQLTKMYEPHLQVPDVLVSLETPAAVVYVSGEVNQPGKVALDRPMTVLEAIGESGGFSKFANPKQVFVIRNEKGKQKRYVLNLANTFDTGAESQAFYLRPFDMVYVKQSVW